MKTFEYIRDLKVFVANEKNNGRSIGFVPTMGALHEGHFSLIKSSQLSNDVTIVSIFVNPIQFNNKEDLENYPRNNAKDINALKKLNVDIAFIPDVKEMYPEPDHTVFNFGLLDKVMEGKYRKGHFRGVAIVVKKLFEIVQPDKAYFGEKDFQQLVIIKELVKQLNLPVEIVLCPIIREKDGLAMSSRNQLLTKKQRLTAANISHVLFQSILKAKEMSVNQLKQWVLSKIQEYSLLKVEYFEIVDDENLQPINDWKGHTGIHGCIAVKVGSIRLIDNIKYN